MKPRVLHQDPSAPPQPRHGSRPAVPAWRRASARIALLAILTVAVAAACGVRTEPRAPEDTAARAPDKIDADVRAKGVTITWTRPTKTVDGARLYDLAKFLVERQTGDGYFQTIATIDVTDLDRIRPQQTFQYVDTEVPPGTVRYRVRAVAADGEPGVPTEPVPVTSGVPRAREENRDTRATANGGTGATAPGTVPAGELTGDKATPTNTEAAK